MSSTLLHSDGRGRISLGKIVQPNRDYRVIVGSHGAIVLEPVTTISDYEAAVMARPELVTALDTAIAAAARGEGEIRERQRRPGH